MGGYRSGQGQTSSRLDAFAIASLIARIWELVGLRRGVRGMAGEATSKQHASSGKEPSKQLGRGLESRDGPSLRRGRYLRGVLPRLESVRLLRGRRARLPCVQSHRRLSLRLVA